ncbi:MAG: VCBS repeat-containing protein [Bryobacterales bacterium]|nr:VCBS repeat-containing protein [Bryobacterales bacterium]MEB2359821.1 VCBS repeat-containing protein [Bryobacterales bacterium]
MRSLLLLGSFFLPLVAGVRFQAQEIATEFGVTYAVAIADVNRDGKPDIVAINPTRVVWFENPSWTRHIILDGATKKDNVCIAPHDIDGDGYVDFAVGADWQPVNTKAGGSLQWIQRRAAHDVGLWSLIPIAEEPTLHRIRWGDVDGDGRAELIVAPLHGRGNQRPDWNGQGARILVFRIPGNPASDPWPVEVADDSLHIVHNFLVTDFDADGRDDLVTASREGVHVLARKNGGNWRKTRIGEGSPGEIKLGRSGGKRVLATVEPWHGNSVVIYSEPGNGDTLWPRTVIEDQLQQAHALGWGDFDGDGDDELAVGWREGAFGVAMYKRGSRERFEKIMVDEGGMAAEDLLAADLDGDGRPEIVAGGRKTANIRIYWNVAGRHK